MAILNLRSVTRRVGAAFAATPPAKAVRRAVVRPRWGNLKRFEPFSDAYGGDRGKPVDRVYIEHFLAAHATAVRGRVLEVKDATYTRRYGGDAVTGSDVLDVDPANRHATVIADLGALGSLPAATFDTFILTQTLQLIPDPERALRNAWDALKPGGTLLITVPTATKVEPAYADLWRWTPDGLQMLVARTLPDAHVQHASYGNLVALIAYLYGMAVEDLDAEDLVPFDARYPLIAAIRVDRPVDQRRP